MNWNLAMEQMLALASEFDELNFENFVDGPRTENNKDVDDPIGIKFRNRFTDGEVVVYTLEDVALLRANLITRVRAREVVVGSLA